MTAKMIDQPSVKSIKGYTTSMADTSAKRDLQADLAGQNARRDTVAARAIAEATKPAGGKN